MSTAVIVVNNDPSISYEGVWATVQSQGASVHASACAGGQTSFSYTFSGTQISIVGGLLVPKLNDTDALVSTYSIDNSTPFTYRAPTNITADTGDVEFYTSPVLSDGQHTLFANVTSCSSNHLYIMLSILYVPSSITSVASASRTVISSFPTSSNTVSGSSESHSSTPVGAIVGGVIGGVALLIISAIAIWFFCFRPRHGQPYFYKSAEAGDLLSQEVKPFNVPGPQSPPSTASSPPSQGPNSYYAPTFAPASPPASDTGGSSTYGGGSGTAHTRQSFAPSTTLSVANPGLTVRSSPNQPQSKAAEAGLLSVPQEATYHADSGVRFGPSGEASGSGTVPADVPPSYTPN
ncbi:hypothetical protein QCA50_007583 [Cerrena zonata]|uniref:Uncharacterized protein n=1 Tax=Cerrena zonata TaxID=2478898 RepID=A0AAW0GBF4_9APHY